MKKKIVYVAMSSSLFRIKEWMVKFVFEQGAIPVSCLMLYGYYMYDMVPREKLIEAYKNMVMLCDEYWIFGEVSDGVRDGMIIAKKHKKPIRCFDITQFPKIFEISEDELVYMEGVTLG